jgi:hypothetical protein
MERTIKYVQSRDNDYSGHTRYGITNIRENGKDNQVCTNQRLSLSLDFTDLIVLSIFSDICYTVSSVPNVVIVSVLYILDCPFYFLLYLLYRI